MTRHLCRRERAAMMLALEGLQMAVGAEVGDGGPASRRLRHDAVLVRMGLALLIEARWRLSEVATGLCVRRPALVAARGDEGWREWREDRT